MLNLSCYRSQKTGFLMSRHMYFLTFSALAGHILGHILRSRQPYKNTTAVWIFLLELSTNLQRLNRGEVLLVSRNLTGIESHGFIPKIKGPTLIYSCFLLDHCHHSRQTVQAQISLKYNKRYLHLYSNIKIQNAPISFSFSQV